MPAPTVSQPELTVLRFGSIGADLVTTVSCFGSIGSNLAPTVSHFGSIGSHFNSVAPGFSSVVSAFAYIKTAGNLYSERLFLSFCLFFCCRNLLIQRTLFGK